MSPTATGTHQHSRLSVVPDAPRQGARGGGSIPPRRPRRGGSYRLGSPGRRVRVAALLFAALFVLLSGRLVWLQGFQSKSYTAMAEKQRLRVITQAAHRGQVTDRNGVVLAMDVDARDIYAQPSKVVDKPAAAAALSPILAIPAADLLVKLNSSETFLYLVKGTDTDIGKAVDKLDIVGIGVLPERRRLYPNGDLAANLLGFTGTDGHGLTGIESMFDKTLGGKDGKLVLEEDPSGRAIPTATRREKAPDPGQGVQLTIDRDLQWKAQQAITAQVKKTRADGGVAVVMDPKTGNILAMANAPTFDPNDPASARASEIGNPAAQWTFEPGSVNKVITMASAIDRGLITPTTVVTVPPEMHIDGFTIRDAEEHGTERLTAAGVLAKSSNLGTILLSRKLGAPVELEKALRSFGLGSLTGLNWPGESAGLLAPSSTWPASQAANVSYGQGMSVTAVQVASVYATIANGGVRMTPRLIAGLVNADGDVQQTATQPGRRVVSAATATTVSQMLEEVTTKQGTAPEAAIPGYRVAGKTGTADRIGSSGTYDGKVGTFVGFAPADHPALVTAVVLDNPKNGYFGGAVSGPVFRDIESFGLASERVVPSGTPAASFPLSAN